METVYADLKGKQIYRDIQRNLMEASKHYLSCTKQPLTEKSIQKFSHVPGQTIPTYKPYSARTAAVPNRKRNQNKLHHQFAKRSKLQHYRSQSKSEVQSSSNSRIITKNLSTI
jgi:hypothetical protein